jgi:hypothetical protein
VHSERGRDLAAVLGVVGQQAHQHGLASVNLYLAVTLSTHFVLKHLRRPALEALLNDSPG